MIDIIISQLVNSDFHNQQQERDLLFESLKNYKTKQENFQCFSLLEDDFLPDELDSNPHELVLKINKYLKNNIVESIYPKINNNSRYLFFNGEISPLLPAHYKFDLLFRKKMNLELTKELIVPEITNTIRILFDIALIKYLPTNKQIQYLLNSDIRIFRTTAGDYDSIFDKKILSLPRL
jgi:hypothetical protein